MYFFHNERALWKRVRIYYLASENERRGLARPTEQGPVPEAACEGGDGGVVLQRGEDAEQRVDAAEGGQVQHLQDRQRVGAARPGSNFHQEGDTYCVAKWDVAQEMERN